MDPWDPVGALGGVEDATDQRDQLGLGDLTHGRFASLASRPVMNPDVDTSAISHAVATANPAAFCSATHA